MFGAIERGTRKCFEQPVENTAAATLLPLIARYVLPGTHIMSDGASSFDNHKYMPGKNYRHSVIIHKQNFVDPTNSEIHTQNIECLWSHMKAKIKRMFGSEEESMGSYFKEFLWRQQIKDIPGTYCF